MDVSSPDVVVPLVLIEIQQGRGLALSAVGRLFPASKGAGTSIDPSTVFRWVTRGLKLPSGGVVKLEAVRCGGRWLTSRDAVTRWCLALTGDAAREPATDILRSPAARSRGSKAAAEQLKRLGI